MHLLEIFRCKKGTISISVNIKNILYVKKVASVVGFEEGINQLLDSGKYLVNAVEINKSYKYPT